MERRGRDLAKLFAVADSLRDDVPLAARHRPHLLSGNWEGFRECHIEPDWLLVYQINDKNLILVRTGTHSDLF